MSPTAPHGNSDDASRTFLEVVGQRAAEDDQARRGDRNRRLAGLIAVVVGGAFAVWAMFSATEPVDAASGPPRDTGASATVIGVRVPPEPERLRSTEVWILSDQRTQLTADDEGRAAIRVDDAAAGFVAGLRSDDGAIVALAVVPPGLELPDDQLLVSPASTVLGLLALHPNVTAADLDTYHARLVNAAKSEAFAEAERLVDGTLSLSDPSDELVAAVERLAEAAVGTDVAPSCRAFELVGTPPTQLARCDDGTLETVGPRWVIVFDTDGRACAAVPPATRRADRTDVARLARLLADGTSFASDSAVTDASSPGVVDPTAACGDGASPADPDAGDALRLTGALHGYLDDALPLSGYVGGPRLSRSQPDLDDVDFLAALAGFGEGLGVPVPTARERIALVGRVLAAEPVAVSLGIGRDTGVPELVALLERVVR